ncbi:MAG TPA: glutamine synthetase type III [Clostridiales bacterium]|nr:glutamine synthetase type III [Clostridiales bacterium]
MEGKLTDIFGINVFNDAKMVECLPKKIYVKLKQTIENGDDLDVEVAEVVANAMKDWAIDRGATHYTHWFQPMTGITAEKHDSFISPTVDGKVIMEFSGKELIKGEPDASAFPSGGIRSTFEARGYTAWDCTSPAFLREDASGVTLCIPTAFCSYTGEALDKKTPLLRSMETINDQAVRILKLFGHTDVTSVSSTVGAEQEYFLIDKEEYLQREDLIFTGRTLFGAMPPKGQELADHYFGHLRERVAAFMKDLNEECWKMGILAKTQHNEAAPAQHEMAPIYSTVNIATDHNQLTMECMKRVANHHGLECLLHEKPFEGVNGSGKHNNWSLVTNTGKNLFDPGTTPHENVQFLLFFSAVLKAVDEHADILRLSASNAGNEHRLGANEAPPAVISVFIGDQLEDVIFQLIETGEATSSKKSGKFSVGVHRIPEFYRDATDRNRTSPFAFTNNKFEFRMIGSSMSIADANTVINTIVADALSDMADELECSEDFDLTVHDLIKKTVTDHYQIVFNGNGYSMEWEEEAARRGLTNYPCYLGAIPTLVSDKTVNLYEKHHVFSKSELYSRLEVEYENYSKTINIEGITMIQMTKRKYIPAVIRFSNELAQSINSIKTACEAADISVQEEMLISIQDLLSQAQKALKQLEELIKNAETIANEDLKPLEYSKNNIKGQELSLFFKNRVIPVMEDLRKPIDQLELIIPKDLWPVPTYGDMLFEV